MATIKTKAVVLGGVNIKEKDRLIDIFSLEEGRITLSMKGVRGEKAKLKMAKEPFCFGEFVIEKGSGNGVVTQVEIIDNFYDLTKNLDKFYEGCAVLDLVRAVTNESDARIFIELLQALKTLCYENVKKYYVFDKFLLKITEILGFSFDKTNCESCKANLNLSYFDFTKGCLVCPNCKTENSYKIGKDTLKAFQILSETDYDKLNSLTLTQGSEKEVLKILALNLEWRVGVKVLKMGKNNES